MHEGNSGAFRSMNGVHPVGQGHIGNYLPILLLYTDMEVVLAASRKGACLNQLS